MAIANLRRTKVIWVMFMVSMGFIAIPTGGRKECTGWASMLGLPGPKDPVRSPFFADLHGMFPMLFMTSTRDMMLSDTTLRHRAFFARGSRCKSGLPESREADGFMANFLDRHLGTK